MTSTSIPSSPPAKMKRYCAFNPLNSTVLPIPLLILYLFILSRLEEEGLQYRSSHNKEDTGSKPACCCFAGVRVAAAKFVVHLHSPYESDDRTDGVNELCGRAEIRGDHLGGFCDTCRTVSLGESPRYCQQQCCCQQDFFSLLFHNRNTLICYTLSRFCGFSEQRCY